MSASISLTVRNAMCQALVDSIGANATLNTYSGEKPVDGGLATVLLSSHNLSTIPASVNNAVITFNPIANGTTLVDGEVSWARVSTSSGDFILDVDCGGAASSADIIFSDTNFIEGGVISIASFKFNEGNE